MNQQAMLTTTLLLAGTPISYRLKDRGQTKCDLLVLQFGGLGKGLTTHSCKKYCVKKTGDTYVASGEENEANQNNWGNKVERLWPDVENN
uniref:Uncharacterized protein n=1 Tax=Arion vulgaris TaxID=1028688 RepID=A0A0B7ATB6_9EUPU